MLFAVFSLLPWFHVMTAGTDHAGHGCCHQTASVVPARGSAAAIASSPLADAPDACWVCQCLISLLHHHAQTDNAVFVGLSPSSTYVARAPHAPVILQIFPASRAQAPPARI